MNFKKVKSHVEIALNILLEQDRFLLVSNVNERTISHKLAEYLQKEFSGWNVDCEYNRKFEKIKKLQPEGIESNDTDAKTVYPDIIIHRRNTENNLLIIEIKKNASGSGEREDKEKIMCFMSEYHYKYGLFIDFKTGTEKVDVKNKEWLPKK